MAFYRLSLAIFIMELILENRLVRPDLDQETTESEIPSEATIRTTFYPTARTVLHIDALIDEDEFTEGTKKVTQALKATVKVFVSKETKKPRRKRRRRVVVDAAARKRKPLPEDKLIKQPFYFGCCHNSTNVGCAGVCPETCEYRSTYCIPLCGPPCRCKRGYVYNIQRRGCTLRSDCPRGIYQSSFGVYRVFL